MLHERPLLDTAQTITWILACQYDASKPRRGLRANTCAGNRPGIIVCFSYTTRKSMTSILRDATNLHIAELEQGYTSVIEV